MARGTVVVVRSQRGWSPQPRTDRPWGDPMVAALWLPGHRGKERSRLWPASERGRQADLGPRRDRARAAEMRRQARAGRESVPVRVTAPGRDVAVRAIEVGAGSAGSALAVGARE